MDFESYMSNELRVEAPLFDLVLLLLAVIPAAARAVGSGFTFLLLPVIPAVLYDRVPMWEGRCECGRE